MTEPESPGRDGEADVDPTAEDGQNGDAASGEVADGDATDGDATSGDATDGDATIGDATDGARTAGNGDDGGGDPTGDEDEFRDVDDELVERVRESDPDAIAREIATLELEVEGLQAELGAREEEIEELTAKLKRKQADFENYKKRMNERREEEKQRATEGLVERLLSVRDNLQRAIEQDEDVDIRDGVASTLRQFDDVLRAENVEPIEPEPGEAVDPHRHQVLARVDADVPEGTVAEVHRPGYEMADSVLREAQVTVGEGSGDDGDTEASDQDAGGEYGDGSGRADPSQE